MNVDNIRLINIRNYSNINLNFNKNINIFIGKNAQGKTNLIESIYMCATGKSFRTNRDREIINFSKNEAYIGTYINLGSYDKFIEIKLQKDKPKIIRINKTELKNHRELNSGLYVVLFSPDDLRIVKDGPQERRNFIDSFISQLKPVYNYNLNRYKKILFQRNNLLKSSKFKKDTANLLDLFDVQIAKVGTSIAIERYNFINLLDSICKDIHLKITKDKENLSLNYSSNIPILNSKEEIEKNYINLLKLNNDKDLEYGTTEIGPHRDDLLININGKDAKTFGSQGQQRTVVLSLILSEVELIKNEIGKYPVLLLDDVFSELDEERRKFLVSILGNMQTFITLTDSENLKSMEDLDKTIFYIENGKLKLES
ncbi:MAG: DNA replication/repair protein RecF [Tissierellaceae bacterium]|nr:DNA replication/repair protein RecF [Tissierellaceae bacterium]